MMKKYIKIQNKGTIEQEAFSLIGASTKRQDDTKIGQFGSGNKYAIACLLRNKIPFQVFSGQDEIKFTTEEKSFRNQKIDQLFINGVPTSITTEMGGLTWEVWMAIREIYSNAVDEGMIAFEEADDISTTPDSTCIYIEAVPAIQDIFININDYIATKKELLFECAEGKVYKKHSSMTCVYRKGIKCYETNKQSLFDYDFNDIPIDENRIVKYHWYVPQGIWKMLYQCDNEYVIRTILGGLSGKDFLENNIDEFLIHTDPSLLSEAWKKALSNSYVAPKSGSGYVKDSERQKTKFVPNKLFSDLVSHFGEDIQPTSFFRSLAGHGFDSEVKVEEVHNHTVKEALYFLKECRFEIPYKVQIVRFHDTKMGGVAGFKGEKEEEKKILVDIRAVEKGKNYLVSVIVEEYIHLKHSVYDETREFQDAVIDEFVAYMKKINSFAL